MRLWQTREPELRAMAGTMPAHEIARHYGVTRGGLSYQASRLGISLALPPELRRREWQQPGQRGLFNPRGPTAPPK